MAGLFAPQTFQGGQDRGLGQRQGLGVVGDRRAHPPDRLGPGGIVAAPADHVHVQLLHPVAEHADVELLHWPAERRPQGAHRRAGGEDLVHQHDAGGGRQVIELARAGFARRQHDPRPAAIGLQPRLAQPQGGERLGGGEDAGIDLEFGHGQGTADRPAGGLLAPLGPGVINIRRGLAGGRAGG